MAGEAIVSGPRPLWRKIVNFPFVAMLIAVGVFIVGIIAAGRIVKLLIPPAPGFSSQMEFYVVAVLILIPLYVFVIANLGEPKHNDFRDRKWARHLLLGLIGGAVIFSIAVAIAGALGIYRIVGIGSLNGLLAALIVPTIGAAVTEEMFFRGILFRWLEQFGGSW